MSKDSYLVKRGIRMVGILLGIGLPPISAVGVVGQQEALRCDFD